MSVQTATADEPAAAESRRHQFTEDDRARAQRARQARAAAAAARRADQDERRRAWIRRDAQLRRELRDAKQWGTANEVLELEQLLAAHTERMTAEVALGRRCG